jgi:hypothetical protein
LASAYKLLIFYTAACELACLVFDAGVDCSTKPKDGGSMNLHEIKKNWDLVNSVDWEMTPEEAIALHLEWGPLRSQAYYNSRDNDNETVYFVINTWKRPPILTLVRRRGFDSEELGNFKLPKNLEAEFLQGIGKYKGVYAVEGNVRDWLKKELEV